MTSETKTKAKAPKNCLEAVSRQDTALRLNITDRNHGRLSTDNFTIRFKYNDIILVHI